MVVFGHAEADHRHQLLGHGLAVELQRYEGFQPADLRGHVLCGEQIADLVLVRRDLKVQGACVRNDGKQGV